MTRTLHLAWAVLRPRPAVPGQTIHSPSTTRLRVHLGDLDLYKHVNNGVYLQYMDVARSNYLADLGAFPLLAGRGWYPVVAASTVKYRRSLTFGQRFTVVTRVVGWDARVVYLDQLFSRDGEDVARGWVAGRFLSRNGDRIGAPEVVALLDGAPTTSPPLPEGMAAWARALDVAPR